MSIMLLTWARYISQVGSQTDLSQMKKPHAIFKCSIDTVVLSSPDVEIMQCRMNLYGNLRTEKVKLKKTNNTNIMWGINKTKCI